VLSFPEAGLDDPAAYEGYATRFLRDAADNTFQIYLKESEGRVVHLWADAANESAGFTARTLAGAPARLAWAADSACVASVGEERTVEHRLRVVEPEIRIGHFVLGSMRVERDVQYGEHHMQPFGAPYVLPELRALVGAVAGLPEPERRRHLALLDADSIGELAGRLQPTITVVASGSESVARIAQPSLDARNRLVLELALPAADGQLTIDGHTLLARARPGRPLVLTVRVMTDAAALTPLSRADIFNSTFLAFHDTLRLAHDRALAERPADAAADARVQRFRRLERQVRGFELVSSQEKLMAGLPNYATYFGRDILVTALLMQPIWASGMNEHVLASVLRKLAPDGQVSHEEALGGQAIREHAAEYVALIEEWRPQSEAGDTAAAATLARAQALLADMQRVRENYAMVDDEFQLPILAARYLADRAVTAARKRTFLGEAGRAGDPTTRLTLLLRNLMLVATMTDAYARQPAVDNLVAFPPREDGSGYRAASWRDSGAGYGGGRFAMDVNTIWAPQALEATVAILQGLQDIGLDVAELHRAAPALAGSVLGGYLADSATLERATATWRGAAHHFVVRLSADEARARIATKLASLPPAEARYWDTVLDRAGVPVTGIEFLALSLDADGDPVAVMSTDLGMRWFLDDITGSLLREPARLSAVLTELFVSFQPYPVGLFVAGLGPLVANDAYATPAVWAGFQRDDYHSPRVVWGREVNLLLLGLMRQRAATFDAAGQLRDESLRPFVTALDAALDRTLEAVEASGLKHNELWSYRIEGDRLLPVRWGRSTDVQLWNLTSLAVEFLMAQSPRR
jgi:hypothetical protein